MKLVAGMSNAELDALALEDEDNDDEVEIKRLAALSAVEYERARDQAAERMGSRVSVLDRLVNDARRKETAIEGQGRALVLPEPEPWLEPVDGATLLSELVSAITNHVVMSDASAVVLALWVVSRSCRRCLHDHAAPRDHVA